MTTHYWLKTATGFLQSKAITTARLDCLVLLEDTMRVDRAQLLAEPTMEVTDVMVAHLQKLLIRRSKHEPLAYIRGRAEFYGRQFKVSPAVLVPRPESEAMIELLKSLVASKVFTPSHTQPLLVADIGAGSGALGITAALEVQNCRVELLEVDADALAIAQSNVDLLTPSIGVHLSDLLTDCQQANDILLCNLPYVPDDYPINKAAAQEPPIALFGGQDGLDLYRKLFKQVAVLAKRPLYILTESLPEQHRALAALAADYSYQLVKTADFIQLFHHVA